MSFCSRASSRCLHSRGGSGLHKRVNIYNYDALQVLSRLCLGLEGTSWEQYGALRLSRPRSPGVVATPSSPTCTVVFFRWEMLPWEPYGALHLSRRESLKCCLEMLSYVELLPPTQSQIRIPESHHLKMGVIQPLPHPHFAPV